MTLTGRFLAVACAMGAGIALTGCASEQTGMAKLNAQLGPPDTAVQTATVDDYQIEPLDRLSVSVFEVKDLSASNVQVDGGGVIVLPMIGPVHASGLTTNALSASITERLSKCCLQNPQVTVSVDDSVIRQITVTGAVKDPGVFPLKGPTHLIQALSLAKGLDLTTANIHKVAVFRITDHKRTAAAFDISKILDGKEEDPEIFAGDTIIADSSAAKDAWHNILTALPLATLFAIL